MNGSEREGPETRHGLMRITRFRTTTASTTTLYLLLFVCLPRLGAQTESSGPAGRASTTAERLPDLTRIRERAARMNPLQSLLISRGGTLLLEEYYRGLRPNQAVNVKSISKSLLNPLVGIAIRDGHLSGVDQPIAELLPEYFRGNIDERKREVTLHHVLSMRTGIQSTSFRNYGAWVSSPDWVHDALRRRMVCAPETCMEYSTGNSHLISVILTRVTGQSTLQYARSALYDALGIRLRPWDRDPQGYYLGGNNMVLTPRDLLTFGELYSNDGRHNGQQLVPEEWIRVSFKRYVKSPWNGHDFGYLFWTDEFGGETVHFAWGYGGQYVFIVPRLDLVIVMTSSLMNRPRVNHTGAIRRFMHTLVIPTFRDAPNN